MSTTIDHHGAAATGRLSEQLFKHEVESVGVTLLKTMKDYENWEFENCGGEWGSKKRGRELFHSHQLRWPEAWEKVVGPTASGQRRRFDSDGWIPQLDCRVEVKYSEENGTTEEKVFYDLEKIRDGVYDDKPLVYVLFGPNAPGKAVFELFKAKVDAMGLDNVGVIIDDADLTKTKVWLRECLDQTTIE